MLYQVSHYPFGNCLLKIYLHRYEAKVTEKELSQQHKPFNNTEWNEHFCDIEILT